MSTLFSRFYYVGDDEGRVVKMEFSHRSQALATLSHLPWATSRVRLWAVQSGHLPTLQIDAAKKYDDLAFSPQDDLLVTRASSAVDVWDSSTAQLLFSLEESECSLARFAGGVLAVWSTAGELSTWDAKSGESLFRMKEHTDLVLDQRLSVLNPSVLASVSLDRTARMWDLGSGSCTGVLQHDDGVRRCCFSPTQSHILATGVETAKDKAKLHLWDIRTNFSSKLSEPFFYRIPHKPLGRLEFHPEDSNILASLHWGDNRVFLWDLRTRKCHSVLTHPHPSGTKLGKPREFDGGFCGGQFATSLEGGRGCLWETSTGRCLQELKDNRADLSGVIATALRSSVALGTKQGAICAWDVSHFQSLSSISTAPSPVPSAQSFLVDMSPTERIQAATLPVPGLLETLIDAGAAFDPIGIAPALVALLKWTVNACVQVKVCKVEALHLRQRLMILQPYVERVAALTNAEWEHSPQVTHCLKKINGTVTSATKLLQKLPQEKSTIVGFIKSLFSSMRLVQNLRAINQVLTEAKLDLDTALQVAGLHVSRQTLVWGEEGNEQQDKCSRLQLANQVVAAFEGDMEDLEQELKREGMDLEGFRHGLKTLGADTSVLGDHARAEQNVKSVVEHHIDGCLSGTIPQQGMPDFCLSVDDVTVKHDAILGQGGFGTVCEGTCRGESVAVKMFPMALGKHDRKRAMKEAYILHKTHVWPGVVKFHGIVLDPRRSRLDMALVTELVDGPTLRELLEDEETGRQISDQQRFSWCLQAAYTMHFLHLYPKPYGPIIHGDLKTDNILVSGQGTEQQLKLIDFGCASICATTRKLLTTTSRVHIEEKDTAHSVACTAPEMCRALKRKDSVKRTTATDVYALGMLFYEIITGQQPFNDRCWTRVLVMDEVCNGGRPDLAPCKSKWPLMADLIQDCWHHRPVSRPTMDLVCQRLEDIAVSLLARGFDAQEG